MKTNTEQTCCFESKGAGDEAVDAVCTDSAGETAAEFERAETEALFALSAARVAAAVDVVSGEARALATRLPARDVVSPRLPRLRRARRAATKLPHSTSPEPAMATKE